MFEGSSSKLNEVIEATENFDDKYIIGTGAHGTVYKATLRSGDVYAIKKLVISAHKELAFSTKSSKESDVYSYGVVLLELLTRKMAVDPSFPNDMDIVGWVSSALNGTDKIEAVCDPDLMEEVYGTVEMEEVSKVLALALRCAAREASQRPSMAAVVKELTDARPPAGAGRSLSKKQGKAGPGSQSQSSSY
nr:unnamed protein product [Digitaria exilis]